MATKYATLYKRDSASNIRLWYMEQDGASYRSVSGLVDGEKVTSTWTIAEATNVGRSNELGPFQQATAEIASEYKKKTDRGYFANLESIDTPIHFKPMLAYSYDDYKSKITWPISTQPKLDGVRCIASGKGLFSRQGKLFVSVPHIAAALEPFLDKHPHIILDGELYNHDHHDDFNTIISAVRKTIPSEQDLKDSATVAQYHIYDMFDPTEPKLRFTDRHSQLMGWINELGLEQDSIRLVFTLLAHDANGLDVAYAQFIEKNYEGQIVRFDTPYENKRTWKLLKRKEFIDEEFTVVDIMEGLGNWSGYAKHIQIQLDDGQICKSGLRGDQAFTKDLLLNKDKYIGGQATVRYFNRTPDNIPRFPIAIAFYEKKRDL